jgi:hypothetical protein
VRVCVGPEQVRWLRHFSQLDLRAPNDLRFGTSFLMLPYIPKKRRNSVHMLHDRGARDWLKENGIRDKALRAVQVVACGVWPRFPSPEVDCSCCPRRECCRKLQRAGVETIGMDTNGSGAAHTGGEFRAHAFYSLTTLSMSRRTTTCTL